MGFSPALTLELIEAGYRTGAFPWYNEDESVLWWSPDPRMVLVPENFHTSKNLRRSLKHFPFTLNKAYQQVMEACASIKRKDQEATWIQAEMLDLYTRLAKRGMGHSVEVWQQGELVGGLYGLQWGGVFFGESMFSTTTDASKAALHFLCAHAGTLGIRLIDCQMYTDHLASLGASEIPRQDFFKHLERLTRLP